TSITNESSDTQYPSAKCVYDAIARVSADKRYTMRWDKALAQGVRLNGAEGITTDISNFCHRGTKNANLSNPFNNIYPWSSINLCNIDIATYMALSAGASVKDCIVSWRGDADFSYTHANGVWRYRPEFWAKWWDEDSYRFFDVSPTDRVGYVHYPEAIEGRWHGRSVTLTIDGTDKVCLIPSPGMPGKLTPMSTLHTYAKNYGASVEDIYLYDANDILMIVEYATMNTQNAVGNGVSSLYRQSSDTIQEAATGSATVKILKANNATVIPGAIFDIGTANGGAQVGSFIVDSIADDPSESTLSIVTLLAADGTPASVTVTTAHMWSIHGLINLADEDVGADSGYIGTNGQSNAYYRGQVAFGNLWRYVLGAYRQQNTGHIWIANDRDEADAYDALNPSVHEDTDLVLPQGDEGAAKEGYIQSLGTANKLVLPPFCTAVGGSNANPVGDYCWVPALSAGSTILIAGGRADYGWYCGRFYGNWSYGAGNSYWGCAAVPVLKNP
ncbi:MAG: hypothetical protein PHO41_08750, partial [Eubacteriales bacterium]|nr:hypothetical protein [Eubacteriales bacterium]